MGSRPIAKELLDAQDKAAQQQTAGCSRIGAPCSTSSPAILRIEMQAAHASQLKKSRAYAVANQADHDPIANAHAGAGLAVRQVARP